MTEASESTAGISFVKDGNVNSTWAMTSNYTTFQIGPGSPTKPRYEKCKCTTHAKYTCNLIIASVELGFYCVISYVF